MQIVTIAARESNEKIRIQEDAAAPGKKLRVSCSHRGIFDFPAEAAIARCAVQKL
jgi:hypothetical protein